MVRFVLSCVVLCCVILSYLILSCDVISLLNQQVNHRASLLLLLLQLLVSPLMTQALNLRGNLVREIFTDPHLSPASDYNNDGNNNDQDVTVSAENATFGYYDYTNNVTNSSFVSTLMPSLVPSALPTARKATSNHISDQNFTFGILVVICSAGIALLLIASLRLHIASLLISHEEEDEAEEGKGEELADENFIFNGNKSKVSDNSVSTAEGGELLNDSLEEHGLKSVGKTRQRGK